MDAGTKFFQTIAASLLAAGVTFGGFAEFNHPKAYHRAWDDNTIIDVFFLYQLQCPTGDRPLDEVPRCDPYWPYPVFEIPAPEICIADAPGMDACDDRGGRR